MQELSNKQKQQLKKLTKEFALNFMVLFGSQVDNSTHKESDIDIAVSSQKKLNYREEYLIQKSLSKILQEQNIDLVNLGDSPPLLLFNAAFHSKLLCENTPRSFPYFQMYAFKRYVEAKPLLKLKEKMLAEI
jgi:predicted nucleotidyltransferase